MIPHVHFPRIIDSHNIYEYPDAMQTSKKLLVIYVFNIKALLMSDVRL